MSDTTEALREWAFRFENAGNQQAADAMLTALREFETHAAALRAERNRALAGAAARCPALPRRLAMTSRTGHPYCNPRLPPWERPNADPDAMREFEMARKTQRRRDAKIEALRRETAEAERKTRSNP